MATLRYFAYGSNMLRERLVARVSTAKAAAVGVVRDYRLDFAKVSVDGSGKGDMVSSPGSEVLGVLYEFDGDQKADLDKHEGGHYMARAVVVSTSSGLETAWAYMAEPHRRDPSKVPYDWYLALIIAGARQGGLPVAYVQALEATAFDVDGKEERATRLEALAALAEAGMTGVLDEVQRRAVLTTGG
ncbi:MAG: gamma-glutamylcyclotransferase [Proteobacteria bacterium]|nr:gamma-glutamylcyclotransferase [Pseudomonadota bacterium]